MGTSGAGRFSDYSRSSEIDKCDEIIENELLENYGDYYFVQNNLDFPAVGAQVYIDDQERIVVVETSSGHVIGALSTEYEPIRECIQVRKYNFVGHITSRNTHNGIISIRVTLIGTKNKK